MSNKTLSILSYVTIIGWIIAYVNRKDQKEKRGLVNYHLRQGFGFFIFTLILNVAISIVISIIPSLYFLSYIGIPLFILLIFGIINAANEQQKPIPVIVSMFENMFSFIG